LICRNLWYFAVAHSRWWSVDAFAPNRARRFPEFIRPLDHGPRSTARRVCRDDLRHIHFDRTLRNGDAAPHFQTEALPAVHGL
jgi:hypothetical protein